MLYRDVGMAILADEIRVSGRGKLNAFMALGTVNLLCRCERRKT